MKCYYTKFKKAFMVYKSQMVENTYESYLRVFRVNQNQNKNLPLFTNAFKKKSPNFVSTFAETNGYLILTH